MSPWTEEHSNGDRLRGLCDVDAVFKAERAETFLRWWGKKEKTFQACLWGAATLGSTGADEEYGQDPGASRRLQGHSWCSRKKVYE